MYEWTRLSGVMLITSAAIIAGCDRTSSDSNASSMTPAATAENAPAGEKRAPDVRSMGSITIGETTLAVSGTGAWRADGTLNLNIDKTSGPLPQTLRIWAGERSGEGSMKVRADAHDDHFHAQVKIPGTVTSTTLLWVEIEDADGNRDSRGIRMN